MIRGTRRALEKKPQTNAKLNASIHNRFDIEVVDAKTGKVKQRAQAENVVCDYLWTKMLNKSSSTSTKWFQTILVGDGTGTPSATDTTLFNQLASYTPEPANDVYKFDRKNHVASLTRKVSILETALVGKELTEVGISNASSNTCTHAMFTDMNGNPVSILKTDADIIHVYATAFVHWGSENDEWFTFNKNSNFLKYALGQYEPTAANFYMHYCGQPSSTPTTGGYFNDTITTDVASRKLKFTAPRLAAAAGNLEDGGFTAVAGGSGASEFIAFVHPDWYAPPPIIGEALGVGDGSTTAFATKFRDISSATVYVDGSAVPATTKPIFPFVSNEVALFALKLVDKDGFTLSEINTDYISPNTTRFFENPYTDVFGIAKLTSPDWESNSDYAFVSMYMSDDLKNWETVVKNTKADATVPEALRRKKYIKLVATDSRYGQHISFETDVDSAHNVFLDVAPAEGAVITIDYTPGTIAKDADHVFDFSIEFTFGEYNPNA